MFDTQQTCLGHDGITIKIIPGNLIEEKTVYKNTFKNIFQLPGHIAFLQDTYITLNNKTNPRAPAQREDYWIHSLQTKAPMGPNVEGGY